TNALESMREPLESGAVTISRARGSVTFPARFLLVAAMNPCPCGYYGDSVRACTCPEAQVSRYQRRVSGPLMDRIDLFAEVPRVAYEELSGDPAGERSEVVRARVIEARERQTARLGESRALTNSEMGPLEVRRFCQDQMAPEAQPLLASAMQQLGLSARAFHRVLKVARTVADLARSDRIEAVHLAEAIQYRRRGAD
ncbi:MAG: ATP-binding protein, partial [Dehalococcoidia bacterium]